MYILWSRGNSNVNVCFTLVHVRLTGNLYVLVHVYNVSEASRLLYVRIYTQQVNFKYTDALDLHSYSKALTLLCVVHCESQSVATYCILTMVLFLCPAFPVMLHPMSMHALTNDHYTWEAQAGIKGLLEECS